MLSCCNGNALIIIITQYTLNKRVHCNPSLALFDAGDYSPKKI